MHPKVVQFEFTEVKSRNAFECLILQTSSISINIKKGKKTFPIYAILLLIRANVKVLESDNIKYPVLQIRIDINNSISHFSRFLSTKKYPTNNNTESKQAIP